jgi:HTH-type transcriptional regulator/antitoxin HipB
MRVTTARDLGNLVRERRMLLNLSQGQLAVRSGTSRVTVNKVESGHSGAALSTVLRLLGALDLGLNVEPKPTSRLTKLLADYGRADDALYVDRKDPDEPSVGDLDLPTSDELER